jgi:tetratricopeptide (TPR) repeat protein
MIKPLIHGLLAASLSLTGVGLLLPQPTQSQTQATPDQTAEIEGLLELAAQQWSQNQREQALATCQQALLIARRLSLKQWEATTLNNIGYVYHVTGQPQKALEYYTQALPISRAVNDKAGEATTLNNIGGVYHATGQPQKALEYYTQALPIFRAVNDKAGEARETAYVS